MKTIIPYAIAASLVLSGCAGNTIKEHRNGSIVQLNEINVHHGPETAYYRLNREEGEKQLEKLTKEDKEEDLWMYIEKRKLWIDIGYNKESDDVVMARANLFHAAKFLEEGDRITFYHNHPAKRFDYEKGLLDPKNFTLLCKNFPSAGDYAAHHKAKSFMQRVDLIVQPSRIVCPNMTVEFDTNGNYRENDVNLPGKISDAREKAFLGSVLTEEAVLRIPRTYLPELNRKKMERYFRELEDLGLILRVLEYH